MYVDLGCAWRVPGVCLGVLGVCLGCAWRVPGAPGMCLGCAWRAPGVCLAIRIRHKPSTPRAHPKHAPGTRQAHQAHPRHAPSTRQAHPKHTPGAPQAHARHTPSTLGTRQEKLGEAWRGLERLGETSARTTSKRQNALKITLLGPQRGAYAAR